MTVLTLGWYYMARIQRTNEVRRRTLLPDRRVQQNRLTICTQKCPEQLYQRCPAVKGDEAVHHRVGCPANI